jgi:hypothetical protein
MLYQLALYALADPARERKSVILYPTLATAPPDQVIQVRALATGSTLEELLRAKGLQASHRKAALAHQLSFGSSLG